MSLCDIRFHHSIEYVVHIILEVLYINQANFNAKSITFWNNNKQSIITVYYYINIITCIISFPLLHIFYADVTSSCEQKKTSMTLFEIMHRNHIYIDTFVDLIMHKPI